MHHLKLAYQWEGINAFPEDTLGDLVFCLLKAGEPKTALEVLQFSRNRQNFSLPLKFALAEALLLCGKEIEGKQLYATCFLEDPSKYNPSLVHWQELKEREEEAKSLESSESWKYVLCVLAFRKKIFATNANLTEEKMQSYANEIQILKASLERGEGDFLKLRCLLESICLYICENGQKIQNQRALVLAKQILEEWEKV